MKNRFKWRPANSNDVGWISYMRRDDDLRLNLHTIDTYTPEQCKKWLENLSPSSQRLAIMNETSEIGLFRIDKIDYQNQNCYFGLDIKKEYRGRGFAKTIWKMMLKEWFENRNMNTIYLEVLEFNAIAIHIYESLGFLRGGRFRNAVYRKGKWHDSIIMSMTRTEYHEKYL